MIAFYILIPFLSSLLSFFVKNNFRYVALVVAFIVFIGFVSLVSNFSTYSGKFNFFETFNMGGYEMQFGIDGISYIFILLTSCLTLICIATSWNKSSNYLALFLLLEGIVIGLFSSLDLITFYVFFEASLVPMFFIIGIWGSDNRIYASFKFFLYTLAGSVAFLIAVIFLYLNADTASIIDVRNSTIHLSIETQKWLWFAFFIAFAVKIPMIPFHTWLPDAHVQAPTAGSVILAGVLIKMGAYGFLRLSIPLFPEISQNYAQMIFVFSIVAVIYASLVALVQTDIKKVIAYSSIAHMGLVTGGIFSFNEQGIVGAIFQMFSHGIISSGLFLCVGVIYDRKHTRDISCYSGLVSVMPLYTFAFITLTMASIGLPGTSGFIGEFFPVVGVFQVAKISSSLMALGVILSAVYMLLLCKRVIWGQVNDRVVNMIDLSCVEMFFLFSLIILVIIFGFQPNLIINFIEEPARNLINFVNM